MFKKRGAGGEGGGQIRKRTASAAADQEGSKEDEINMEALVQPAKKARQTSGPNFSTTKKSADEKYRRFAYQANRESQTEGDQKSKVGAVAEVETETPHDRDSRAVFERKGGKNYDGGPGHAVRGPARAAANIRVVSFFDYKPDICKDYYETGFCGYGDNCKYAHIREDYKSGWEIDKEFDKKEKDKADKLVKMLRGELDDTNDEDADNNNNDKDDGLPFACYLCRQTFVDPVVTKCKHYFCSKCALDYYSNKSNKCAICSEPTLGIFNTAFDIINKQKKQQQQQQKQQPQTRKQPTRQQDLRAIDIEDGEDAPVVVVTADDDK